VNLFTDHSSHQHDTYTRVLPNDSLDRLTFCDTDHRTGGVRARGRFSGAGEGRPRRVRYV
jgi:hypothetical protein